LWVRVKDVLAWRIECCHSPGLTPSCRNSKQAAPIKAVE
jgi:hypothetical protein